ncbi:Endonuclease/exonuclease/phosphatase [Vararia minispora EC-137]|uniref:Endonuclease/exonuclease/phosphatase n=1 Tax=Vararia minispora EC-137 TaxID=1314806 RepID=A0ACB8QAQ7_9AGAM|nr:Endonuclease/exonuclease/phosphatase [Vararia minispora EC-137]
MRIITWNINGIRTVPQYHPWNAFKTWNSALRELGGDIICFQEMKTTRAAIGRNFALPDSFDAFFSFPVTRGGYSGVAVYTDRDRALPLKVEEGLSGKMQPKPPLSADERVSTCYPCSHELELMENIDGNTLSEFTALDSEGRALVLDFGLFVLINIYCPNETSGERLPFKMNYHYMLQERVRRLVQDEGRQVIVTGDMNICAAPMDHCDGHLPSNSESFYEHPARKWIRSWLEPNGLMIDVTRRFHPDRKGMYTCWNTKINARETNYGTRIDYFLVTPGLFPWIKQSDIQPSIKGSDHCPVFLDLHDEIILSSGERRSLRDAMRMLEGRKDPPRLASRFWTEFQGRQMLMSSFFTKQDAAKTPAPSLSAPPLGTGPTLGEPSMSQARPSAASDLGPTIQKGLRPPQLPPQPLRKRPSDNPSLTTSKAKKVKAGQARLSSFFTKPPTDRSPSSSQSSSQGIVDVDEITPTSTPQETLDADYELARSLSASQQADLLAQSEPGSSSHSIESKEAWSVLFAPLQPPKCTVHGEPAKEYRVNKPGPNKGKVFYVCSRPVGPGYDKGVGERLREEVDHRYKCNFFKWAGDVKRESLRAGRSKT